MDPPWLDTTHALLMLSGEFLHMRGRYVEEENWGAAPSGEVSSILKARARQLQRLDYW